MKVVLIIFGVLFLFVACTQAQDEESHPVDILLPKLSSHEIELAIEKVLEEIEQHVMQNPELSELFAKLDAVIETAESDVENNHLSVDNAEVEFDKIWDKIEELVNQNLPLQRLFVELSALDNLLYRNSAFTK